ncbi:MAG: phosphoribosylformylglycinamidine synthase subunit PurS [Gaiellales bacterium]
MRITVLVRPKQGILDPQGDAVRAGLEQLGFAVREARVGRIIDLEVDAADARDARTTAEHMCEQLLANPLIESYEIDVVAGTDVVSEHPPRGATGQ